MPVQHPEFLGQVSRLAQFEYTNPAFDPDVTVAFERDLEAIESAPVPEFQDIRILSRPYFAETAERAVRVSRLGTRSSMVTRSGLQLGQPVHFYFDISPIASVPSIEAIEMQTLPELTGTNIIVNAQAESSFITPETINVTQQLFDETDLVDPLTENFNNAHLVFSTSEENETITLPSFAPSSVKFTFGVDYGVNIFNAQSSATVIVVPTNASTKPISLTGFPDIDYILDPAFLPKKKRKVDLLDF